MWPDIAGWIGVTTGFASARPLACVDPGVDTTGPGCAPVHLNLTAPSDPART